MTMHSIVQPNQQGFTLLELLIAMSLMTLVMLGLGSSMYTVSQTQTRADARLTQMDVQRVNVALLRTLLGNISSELGVKASADAGTRVKFFLGDTQGMQWLGVMPARFGAAGRMFFRLALEPSQEGAGNDLVLWFEPWNGEKAWPEFSQASRYIVARKVQEFSIAYQSEISSTRPWLYGWSQSRSLPASIGLNIVTEHGTWPKTVIALYESDFSSSDSEPAWGGSVR